MPTPCFPRRFETAALSAKHSAAPPWPRQGLPGIERDAQFIELLNGYRRSGGLARATEMMYWLRQRGAEEIATVARWIAKQEVVHFEWQTETWLPVFQFGADDLRPHAAVHRSILELAPLMPPWELAQWFARTNVELAGRCPADVLAADPEALWQAARADRYLLDA